MRTKVATVENAFFTAAFFAGQLKAIVLSMCTIPECGLHSHSPHKNSVVENFASSF